MIDPRDQKLLVVIANWIQFTITSFFISKN